MPPDFEIRYFHADGQLALVQMSSHASERDARAHAQNNIADHARFELRDGGGNLLPHR